MVFGFADVIMCDIHSHDGFLMKSNFMTYDEFHCPGKAVLSGQWGHGRIMHGYWQL